MWSRCLVLRAASKPFLPCTCVRSHASFNQAAEVMEKKREVKGIIFDMDGTCTEAVIDFAEMRRRAGIPKGDILAVLDSWPEEKRTAGLQAIEDVEQEALPRMKLMPGLNELCEWLDELSIPRDFKPYKPSPAGIQHICDAWGICPSECIMIGDSQKDDVVSGNRAGAIPILIDVEGTANPQHEDAEEWRPFLTVNSMQQFQEVLSSRFRLVPQQSRP